MEKFKAITVQDIMNRIDAKCYGRTIHVIEPSGNLISLLNDRGKLAAGTAIVNGSGTARSLFLNSGYKAVPMSEIMDAIDKRIKSGKEPNVIK